MEHMGRGGFMSEVLEQTSATLAVEAMEILARCGRIFTDSAEREAIYFSDDAVPKALTLVSGIARRAAAYGEAARVKYLLHIIEHGPALCSEVVEQVERRTPPVLKGSDLPMAWMESEGI
jgi:hypothetical protein